MFSHLAFTSPWLLGFFVALPALWWLLRLMPPAPKKISFPAIALLRNLVTRESTPAHAPWWLLLLRVVIAALIIAAFAEPTLDPVAVTNQKGALLIAVDNDWAAARDWSTRQKILTDIAETAAHDKRAVYLLTTAPDANNELPAPDAMAAEAAANKIAHLSPEAWGTDWKQAAANLENLKDANITDTIWLASGVGDEEATAFSATLQKIAPLKTYGTTTPIYSLTPPVLDKDEPTIAVMRANADDTTMTELQGIAENGDLLMRWPVSFAAGSPRTMQPLTMPPELRNRIARFEIATDRTAASTLLLDGGWQRHAVGISGDAAELDRHSYLSEIFYLDRALKPYADLHLDTLDHLLAANMPVIILTDTATINADALPKLTAWLKKGGVLVRFAGERFARAADHAAESEILPVPLRQGGHNFGGALSWDTPQKLKDFPANSPFHTLAVPDDVIIHRQILAEPGADLAAHSWANLQDGTPLVTAKPVGQGLSILFHVPARSGWSNLPLSGTFVEMLQKIAQLAHNEQGGAALEPAMLPALSTLDAYGQLHDPVSTARPITSDDTDTTISPQHPPGLYGTDKHSVARNLGNMIGQPTALQNVALQNYVFEAHGVAVKPYLLLVAFLLLLFDFVLSLGLRGLLRFACVAFALLAFAHPVFAANDDKLAAELTSKPYLGYVRTGDSEVDRTSELGLRGLATIAQRRTSLDEIGVARVDVEHDDLTFFPLLYWPVTVGQAPVSTEAAQRITHYLRHGGMILFDAAGAEESAPAFLRTVLAGVDMPPLIPLPEKHVLKRSFYLLDHFPGRFTDRDFWLEPEEASTYDGVASILYGSNGWAAAWAMDDHGAPLFPCTPGGEEQREYAYRFGINLIIYALTGNYKTGQGQMSKALEKL